MKIDILNTETPTEPGQYFWKGEFGSVELFTLYLHPESCDYGIKFQSYIAIAQMRGRNATQLRGLWSDKLEF